MDKEIIDYVRTCKTCQTQKLTRIRPTKIPTMTDTPTEPNDKIVMNIFGPLRKTRKKNEYILSIQDMLTKYLILIPIPNPKAETIISKLIEHYIYIFSSPKHILTNQGSNFVCKLMSEFERTFQIKHIKTTAFHPQSNASLETHAVIKDLIKTCIADKNNEWDENLNIICMVYNTSVHENY